MRKSDLTEDQVAELSEIFRQLGDPSRARITDLPDGMARHVDGEDTTDS